MDSMEQPAGKVETVHVTSARQDGDNTGSTTQKSALDTIRSMLFDRKLQNYAGQGKLQELVGLLSAPGKADVNIRDVGSNTALHDAAWYGQFDVVETLLDLGAEVDATDLVFGRTPLHCAAARGQLDIVKLLVKAGACVDEKDPLTGGTPTHWACWNKHPEVMKYLLVSAGANPNETNKEGKTILWTARRNQMDDELINIVKRCMERYQQVPETGRNSTMNTAERKRLLEMKEERKQLDAGMHAQPRRTTQVAGTAGGTSGGGRQASRIITSSAAMRLPSKIQTFNMPGTSSQKRVSTHQKQGRQSVRASRASTLHRGRPQLGQLSPHTASESEGSDEEDAFRGRKSDRGWKEISWEDEASFRDKKSGERKSVVRKRSSIKPSQPSQDKTNASQRYSQQMKARTSFAARFSGQPRPEKEMSEHIQGHRTIDENDPNQGPADAMDSDDEKAMAEGEASGVILTNGGEWLHQTKHRGSQVRAYGSTPQAQAQAQASFLFQQPSMVLDGSTGARHLLGKRTFGGVKGKRSSKGGSTASPESFNVTIDDSEKQPRPDSASILSADLLGSTKATTTGQWGGATETLEVAQFTRELMGGQGDAARARGELSLGPSKSEPALPPPAPEAFATPLPKEQARAKGSPGSNSPPMAPWAADYRATLPPRPSTVPANFESGEEADSKLALQPEFSSGASQRNLLPSKITMNAPSRMPGSGAPAANAKPTYYMAGGFKGSSPSSAPALQSQSSSTFSPSSSKGSLSAQRSFTKDPSPTLSNRSRSSREAGKHDKRMHFTLADTLDVGLSQMALKWIKVNQGTPTNQKIKVDRSYVASNGWISGR